MNMKNGVNNLKSHQKYLVIKQKKLKKLVEEDYNHSR